MQRHDAPILVLRHNPVFSGICVLAMPVAGYALGSVLVALALAGLGYWLFRPCAWLYEDRIVLRDGWRRVSFGYQDPAQIRLRDGALRLRDAPLPISLGLLRPRDEAALRQRFG